MTTSQTAHKASAWVTHHVEKEGIARLTILILLLTTIAMLAYTWGYAEGVHNSQADTAEEVRLSAPSLMPSIADLRSHSSTQQQEEQQQEEQQEEQLQEEQQEEQQQGAATEQQKQLPLPPDTSAQPEIAAAATSQGSAPALEELEVLNSTDSSSSLQQPAMQRHRPIGSVRISPVKSGTGETTIVEFVPAAAAPAAAPVEANTATATGETAVSSGDQGTQAGYAATPSSSSSSNTATAPVVAAAAVVSSSRGSINQQHSRADDGGGEGGLVIIPTEDYETTSDDYGQ